MNCKKLYWLLPGRCLLFVGGFMLTSALLGESLASISRWWPIFAIAINLLCLVALLLLTKKKYGAFINYEKGKSKPALVILATILTLAVGMGGMYAAGFMCYGEFPYMDVTMVQPTPVAAAVICVLLLPLSTTLAEDGIYLGAIHSADGNKGITFTAALFYALQHSFIPLLPDARFMLYRFLSFLPLTVLYCFWYRKSRNPLPIMIGHFVINMSTVAMLMISAVSPDMFAYY